MPIGHGNQCDIPCARQVRDLCTDDLEHHPRAQKVLRRSESSNQLNLVSNSPYPGAEHLDVAKLAGFVLSALRQRRFRHVPFRLRHSVSPS